MPPKHEPRKHSPAQMQRVYRTCWTQSSIPQTTRTELNPSISAEDEPETNRRDKITRTNRRDNQATLQTHGTSPDMSPKHEPRDKSTAQLLMPSTTSARSHMLNPPSHTQTTRTQTNAQNAHTSNRLRLDDLTVNSHARTFHDTYPTEHVLAFLYADEIMAYTTTDKHTAQQTARREIIQCLHAIITRQVEEAREL